MKKILVLAIALLVVGLLLGFFGQTQTAGVMAQPLVTFKQFLPIIIKTCGPTPLEITQEVLEPVGRTPTQGDIVRLRITIKNLGTVAITHMPGELFYDAGMLELVVGHPQPRMTLPGALVWDDILASPPLGTGLLDPGASVDAELTFRVIACPAGGATPVRVVLAGAVDANGQTVGTACDTLYLKVHCPGVTVTKMVVEPSTGIARLGDQVTFQIVIHNTGNLPLSYLPLKDTFDPNYLSFVSATPPPDSTAPPGTLSWDDLVAGGPPLAPSDRITVMVTFRVVGCPDDQTAENLALVSGALARYLGDTYSVPDADAETSVKVPCADLSIHKRVVNPASGVVQPGDLVTFEITLENIGNKPVVVLPLDDLFDGQVLEFVSANPTPDVVIENLAQWNDLTSLAPHGFGRELDQGQIFTVTAIFRVFGCPYNKTALNEARVSNAIAIHEGEEWAVPQVSSTARLTVNTGADLCPAISMTKRLVTPASGVVRTGDLVTFEVAITNVGTRPIVKLPLEDIFDLRYLEFVEASVPPNVVTPYHLLWDDLTGPAPSGFGRDLTLGDTFTLTATFRAIGCPPGQVTVNTARVHGVTVINNNVEYVYLGAISRTASVRIACPALEVSKSLVPLPCGIAGVGDPVTFTVAVKNVGNTTLNQVTLVDTYDPAYLEFDSAVPTPDAVVPGTLTWNNLVAGAPLAPGGTVRVTINFTAIASTQAIYPPVTVNVADASGVDEYGFVTPDADAAEVSVGIADADLFIEKEGPAETHPGDTITYQVRYGNNGPDSATYVRILDTIPAGTEFVGDTLCGHVNTGCFIGTLPAGASGSFTVQIFVPFNVSPRTVLENTVSIESGQTPRGPVCGIGDHDKSNNVDGTNSIVMADFGRVDDQNTYSGDFTHEWLGRVVFGETGAPDMEEENDGWLNKLPWYRAGRIVELDILISTAGEGSARYGLAADRRLYLRGWLDRNRDGVFADDELILAWSGGPGMVGQWDYPSKPDGQWPLSEPTFRVKTQFTAPSLNDYTWVRFRLSYGRPPSASGFERFGEIEDHWVGFFNRDP